MYPWVILPTPLRHCVGSSAYPPLGIFARCVYKGLILAHETSYNETGETPPQFLGCGSTYHNWPLPSPQVHCGGSEWEGTWAASTSVGLQTTMVILFSLIALLTVGPTAVVTSKLIGDHLAEAQEARVSQDVRSATAKTGRRPEEWIES